MASIVTLILTGWMSLGAGVPNERSIEITGSASDVVAEEGVPDEPGSGESPGNQDGADPAEDDSDGAATGAGTPPAEVWVRSARSEIGRPDVDTGPGLRRQSLGAVARGRPQPFRVDGTSSAPLGGDLLNPNHRSHAPPYGHVF